MSLADPRSANLAQRPATPPESPLAMPVQDFGARPRPAFPRLRNGWHVWMARLVAFGGAAAAAVVGFQQMLRSFGDNPTPMQWALLVLFVPTFAWVGFSFCNVLAGLFASRLVTPQGPNAARVASHRPNIVLVKADGLAGIREQHHVMPPVGDRRADQEVALVQVDRDDAGGAPVGEIGQGRLLDRAQARGHEHVVRVVEALDRQHHRDLLAVDQREHVDDGAPARAGREPAT